MKHDPIISIIVPVYQVKPYLRECLDSILEQSFTDWEMLLVDDGSTDGGEIVCNEYADKDSRIRVFHQNNAGLSVARNTGLDHARGKYLTMVDSDDVLATRDYLKLLYDALLNANAEMSACGHLWFSDGAKVPLAIDPCSDYHISTGKDFYLRKAFPSETNDIDEQGNIVTKRYSPIGAHGKLYKKELFANVRYPVGHILEDLAVAHRIYLQCSKVAILDAYIYAYRRRPTGLYRSSDKAIIQQEELFAYSDLLAFSQEITDEQMIDYAGRMLRTLLRNKKK